MVKKNWVSNAVMKRGTESAGGIQGKNVGG